MQKTGHFTKNILTQKAGGSGGRTQFIIARLVTRREIRKFNDTALVDFRCYLENLNNINFDVGYLLHGRTVFLKNMSQDRYTKHREARLLDPDGDIRDFLDLHREKDEFKEPIYYLEEMNEEFVKQFGKEARPQLLIFSHYIPCAIGGHCCADVLGKFASDNRYKIFIGYE